MARKTATEDGMKRPPPKQPNQSAVGKYPAHTKGITEVVDANTTRQIKKSAEAKKSSKKIIPHETESDDDFVANTMCAQSQGTKKQTAAERLDIKGKTKNGKKGDKGVAGSGKPKPQGNKEKDGQSTRYKGFETRTTPNTLTDAVKSLTEQQKVAVGSMGLDGMLNLGITYVPTQFAIWLLESFDSKECKLVTPRGDAEIKPMDVNFTLGLPMGGRPIKVPLRTNHNALLVQRFRVQYGDISENKIKCRVVSEKIQKTKEADDIFKLNFLVMFYSTMVDSTASGKAN
ncbi:hypothetical protein QQ045_020265 [Rhodiola kirilowii]